MKKLLKTNYYPFGGVLTHWESNNNDHYRFGYQGEFAEKDDETGYNHFEARNYDAAIGRWLSTDPAGQFYSPYNGMGNNPISGIDPDGRMVDWNQVMTGVNSVVNSYYNQTFDVGFLNNVTVSAGLSFNQAQAAIGGKLVRNGRERFAMQGLPLILGTPIFLAVGAEIGGASYLINVGKNIGFEFSTQLLDKGNFEDAIQSMDVFDILTGTRFSKNAIYAVIAGSVDYTSKDGFKVIGGHGRYHKGFEKAISDAIIQTGVGSRSNKLPLGQEAILEVFGGYFSEKIGDSWTGQR